MLKFGYISELDTANGLVRVYFEAEGIVSNPLPVSMPATKEDKYSFPFVINEHVWCIMDDNMQFGVVGGAIYSAKNKPAGNVSDTKINIDINGDKLQIEIDRNSGNIKLKGKGDIKVECDGDFKVKSSGDIKLETATGEVEVKALSVKIDAPNIQATGNLAVAGQVTAAGFAGASGAPMAAPSGIYTEEDVIAGTTSLKLHTHEDSMGSPTTPPLV